MSSSRLLLRSSATPAAMSSSAMGYSRRMMSKKRKNVSKKSLSPIASMSEHNKKKVHTLGIDIHAVIDSISENSPDMIMDFKEMMITNKMITDIMYSKPGALKTFFAAAKVNIFDETATEDDYRTLCHSIMIYCMINPTYLSISFKKVKKPFTEKIRYHSIGGSKSKKKRTTSQEQKRQAKKDKQYRLFRNRIIIILLLSAGLFTFIYFLPSIIISVIGTGKIAVAAIGAAEAFRRRSGIDLVDDSVTARLSPFGHQLYYWLCGILLTFQTLIARTFIKLLTAENTAEGNAAWKTLGSKMDQLIENSFSSRNLREITTAAAKEGETAKENIKAISATVVGGACRAVGGGFAAVTSKFIDKDSFTGRFIEGATQSPNEDNAKKQELIKKLENIDKELSTINKSLKNGPSAADKEKLTAKKMELLKKHAKYSGAILSYQTSQLSGGPNVDSTMSNALSESFAKLSTNDEVLPVPVPAIKDVSPVDGSSDASISSSISSSMDSSMGSSMDSSMDSSASTVATPNAVDNSAAAVAPSNAVDNSAAALAQSNAVDNSAVAPADNSASVVASSPGNTNS